VRGLVVDSPKGLATRPTRQTRKSGSVRGLVVDSLTGVGHEAYSTEPDSENLHVRFREGPRGELSNLEPAWTPHARASECGFPSGRFLHSVGHVSS